MYGQQRNGSGTQSTHPALPQQSITRPILTGSQTSTLRTLRKRHADLDITFPTEPPRTAASQIIQPDFVQAFINYKELSRRRNVITHQLLRQNLTTMLNVQSLLEEYHAELTRLFPSADPIPVSQPIPAFQTRASYTTNGYPLSNQAASIPQFRQNYQYQYATYGQYQPGDNNSFAPNNQWDTTSLNTAGPGTSVTNNDTSPPCLDSTDCKNTLV